MKQFPAACMACVAYHDDQGGTESDLRRTDEEDGGVGEGTWTG